MRAQAKLMVCVCVCVRVCVCAVVCTKGTRTALSMAYLVLRPSSPGHAVDGPPQGSRSCLGGNTCLQEHHDTRRGRVTTQRKLCVTVQTWMDTGCDTHTHTHTHTHKYVIEHLHYRQACALCSVRYGTLSTARTVNF